MMVIVQITSETPPRTSSVVGAEALPKNN
jgi:hypothetical protein